MAEEEVKIQLEETIENFERLQELQNKIDKALLEVEGYYPA